MKIIVTGSLGHISKPLTQELIQMGHHVTVISSKADRQKEIEALGANAAIGSIEDVDFLTATFNGADAVYTMIPPASYFDQNLDLMTYCLTLGSNYAEAIQRSGVKHVVHLSSIGAHMETGSGIIMFHRNVELILDKLTNVAITFMRPSGFYYNMLGFIPIIKDAGLIASNYGADEQLIWVSPVDIAAAVAEELQSQLTGHNVRYVGSDELTGNETASIIGAAIGIPDLKWILITNEQLQSNLEAAGLKADIAAGLVEMFATQHAGLLTEDYYRHRPVLGKVKTADFAKEFAVAFNSK